MYLYIISTQGWCKRGLTCLLPFPYTVLDKLFVKKTNKKMKRCLILRIVEKFWELVDARIYNPLLPRVLHKTPWVSKVVHYKS